MFEQNRAFLQQSDPGFLAELIATEPKQLPVMPAKKGGFTLAYRDVLLHSKYAPHKEAQQVFSAHQHPDHSIHLHLGFGLGYLLEADQLPADQGQIIVFEPLVDVIFSAMHQVDFQALCAGREVHFCSSVDRLKLLLREALKHHDELFLYALPFHKKQLPDVLRQAVSRVHQELDKRALFGAGFDPQKRRVLDATLKSLPYSWHAPGLNTAYGKLKGMPAVVVLPGPSLERNLVQLKPYANKVAIFTVARAVGALERHNIEPHFLVHNEPQDLSGLFRGRTNLAQTIYLLAEQSHPGLHQHARRKALVYQNPTNPVTQFLIQQFPKQAEKGMIATAGTVATEAFVLALLLGCSPVILIGQDLALTGGQYYAQANDNPAFRHSDREFRRVPGYFGGQVQTLIHYAHFLDWYRDALPALQQKFPAAVMINATEGGAKLEGFQQMKLAAALNGLKASQDVNVRSRFSSAPHLAKPLPEAVVSALQTQTEWIMLLNG